MALDFLVHMFDLSFLLFFFLFLQGVFINPAFIEPFGLTLIEVLVSIFVKRLNFLVHMLIL